MSPLFTRRPRLPGRSPLDSSSTPPPPPPVSSVSPPSPSPASSQCRRRCRPARADFFRSTSSSAPTVAVTNNRNVRSRMTSDHTTPAAEEPAVVSQHPNRQLHPLSRRNAATPRAPILGAGLVGGFFDAAFTAGAAAVIMAFGFGPPPPPPPGFGPPGASHLRFPAPRRAGRPAARTGRTGRNGRTDGRAQGSAGYGTTPDGSSGNAPPRSPAAPPPMGPGRGPPPGPGHRRHPPSAGPSA